MQGGVQQCVPAAVVGRCALCCSACQTHEDAYHRHYGYDSNMFQAASCRQLLLVPTTRLTTQPHCDRCCCLLEKEQSLRRHNFSMSLQVSELQQKLRTQLGEAQQLQQQLDTEQAVRHHAQQTAQQLEAQLQQGTSAAAAQQQQMVSNFVGSTLIRCIPSLNACALVRTQLCCTHTHTTELGAHMC